MGVERPKRRHPRPPTGGGFVGSPYDLAASDRNDSNPANENDGVGFRVAMIPEPSTALLVACGLVGLAVTRR